MAGKPPKITVSKPATTDERPFNPEAHAVIRELALKPPFNGNSNFLVKEAIAHFGGPEKSRLASAEDVRAAIDQIVAKAMAGDADSNSRLPLTGPAQDEWDRGRDSRWNNKVRVADMRERFKNSPEITPEMIDSYVAELEAEEKVKKELINEQSDPKSGLVSCVFELHKEGKPREFQPTTKFRITRGTNGWERQKHPQGDDLIRVGNFYVPPTADGEEPRADAYCSDCRELAWKMGRETNTKLTFHDREGADRKIAAILKTRKKVGAAASQLGLGAKRQGSQMPKAMRTGWKTDRRGSR